MTKSVPQVWEHQGGESRRVFLFRGGVLSDGYKYMAIDYSSGGDSWHSNGDSLNAGCPIRQKPAAVYGL